MKCLYLIVALLLLLPSSGAALFQFRGPHRIEGGFEWYYMHRNRQGGSVQEGYLFGGRFLYDRIRRSALYWAVEGYCAEGRLNGRKSGMSIKSNKRDSEIEGRTGYTWKMWRCLWLTPFIGGGFFEGTNHFVSPSPIEYKIRNRFPYVDIGFLGRYDVTCLWSIGLNFKAKFMVGARAKIIDDPNFSNPTLIIEDKQCFDVDLPITYRFCSPSDRGSQMSITPFYRFRRYGAHENYPFDYIDTRFQIGGLRVMFAYLF